MTWSKILWHDCSRTVRFIPTISRPQLKLFPVMLLTNNLQAGPKITLRQLSRRGARIHDGWLYAESLYIEESDHNAHVQGQLVISLVGFIFRWDQRLRPKLNLNVHFGLSPKMRLTNFAERKLINYSLFSRRICLFTYRSAKKWSDFRSAKLTGDYTNHIYL